MTTIQVVKHAYSTTCQFGFDPRKFMRACLGTPRFVISLIRYCLMSGKAEFPFEWLSMYPILSDFADHAGAASGHYFHQDLWAARKVFERRPLQHIDVGSRIDGFIAHLLVFMSVDVIDIRPLDATVHGLRFIRDDATKLARFADNSIDSVSSLHAAEHFGLGRYGDFVDPGAYVTFMAALQRILRPDGRLYFSVPCGRQRVEFNAHRIFAPATVLQHFNQLSLVSMHAIDDHGALRENCSVEELELSEFACGLFEFTKKS